VRSVRRNESIARTHPISQALCTPEQGVFSFHPKCPPSYTLNDLAIGNSYYQNARDADLFTACSRTVIYFPSFFSSGSMTSASAKTVGCLGITHLSENYDTSMTAARQTKVTKSPMPYGYCCAQVTQMSQRSRIS
jgi:hypothetical protein